MISVEKIRRESKGTVDLKAFYGQWNFRDRAGKTLRRLKLLKNRVKFHDYDATIMIVGKERVGKSTFELLVADYFTDGKMSVDNVCMDANDFMYRINSSKKGDVICFDEAGTNLYSREAMSFINRKLTKAFMVSGLKNVIMLFCIPSFFALDPYMRMHRIDLLFYLPSRGKWKVYSKKRAKKISIYGAKERKMEVQRANDVGIFSTKVRPELETAYRLKEKEFKLQYLDKIDPRTGMLSANQAADRMFVTYFNLLTLIKRGQLEATKIGGRLYFKPEVCDAYLETKVRQEQGVLKSEAQPDPLTRSLTKNLKIEKIKNKNVEDEFQMEGEA